MKLGLNLPAHLLTEDNFAFARQAGATSIIAHPVDYELYSPGSPRYDALAAATTRPLWSEAMLTELRESVERAGLELAAVENLDPSFWSDILIGGPRKDEQLEDVKTLIRRLGAAGIPCLGYYFSIAGVWGQVWDAPVARGGAATASFDLGTLTQDPVGVGEVWGLTYPVDDPKRIVPPVGREELWGRLEEFLREVVPVAEEAGVRLAAHPDDPPLPELRGTPRLLHHPDELQRLLDLVPSPANALDFCQGTMTESVGEGVYEAIERFARQERIAYVHLRNVHGRVPRYHETFIDDGDIDIVKALRLYHESGFDGIVVPDHAPELNCAAPWHAGVAFALGYLRCALQVVESEALHHG